MRIALVAQHGSPLTPATDPNADAQAAALTSLAQSLAGLGHRITIYARPDSRGLPGSAIVAQGVTVEHLIAGPPVPLAADDLTAHVSEFGEALARRWQRSRPDVAHACFWTSGLAALAAARGSGIPVVQSFGSLGVAERRHRRQAPGLATRIRMEACIARSCAIVLAGTSAEASDLIRMGLPRAAVALVPNGVDTARFFPGEPVASRSGRPRLLAVAPLAEDQGLDALVRMLPGVPDAELVIAGGPPKAQLRREKVYRDLRQLAKNLGVRRRLVFTGHVPAADLPALLRSADLLVSAAPYDSVGAVTIAAMACGTPAAVSAVGANRDAVLDETTGLLVAPGRLDLLTRRVRRLLAAPIRLEAFGIAAADRARARYSWDRIGQETVAAYARCLPSLAADTAAHPVAGEVADMAAEMAARKAADLVAHEAADMTAAEADLPASLDRELAAALA
jgi:glycosyltransferase involved in cell wall biosynthesis